MIVSIARKRLAAFLLSVGKLIGKTGISPNTFTLLAIPLAIVSCYLLAKGDMFYAILSIIIVSLWDGLDGSLARATGKVTKFGNYLDAMVDRIVETLFFLGLAFRGYPIESLLIVAGSITSSYAKARVGLIIKADNHDWPAIGDRADRLILLIVILVISLFVGDITLSGVTFNFLSVSLYGLAAMSYIGVALRIVYARKLLSTQSP